MDKLGKALKKLAGERGKIIKAVLQKIYSGNFQGLNIKKLKGMEDIFRARKGAVRIIYKVKDNKIFIIAIEHRKEDTYKF